MLRSENSTRDISPRCMPNRVSHSHGLTRLLSASGAKSSSTVNTPQAAMRIRGDGIDDKVSCKKAGRMIELSRMYASALPSIQEGLRSFVAPL